MIAEEDEADMAEFINLPSTVSGSWEEEENPAKVFEADPRTCATTEVSVVVVGDGSRSETFRPNEVRAWATSNKSSFWAFAFASEALVIPVLVPVPTVAFSQVDIFLGAAVGRGRLCYESALAAMMDDFSYACRCWCSP